MHNLHRGNWKSKTTKVSITDFKVITTGTVHIAEHETLIMCVIFYDVDIAFYVNCHCLVGMFAVVPGECLGLKCCWFAPWRCVDIATLLWNSWQFQSTMCGTCITLNDDKGKSFLDFCNVVKSKNYPVTADVASFQHLFAIWCLLK